jgi:hypothetical protein
MVKITNGASASLRRDFFAPKEKTQTVETGGPVQDLRSNFETNHSFQFSAPFFTA